MMPKKKLLAMSPAMFATLAKGKSAQTKTVAIAKGKIWRIPGRPARAENMGAFTINP